MLSETLGKHNKRERRGGRRGEDEAELHMLQASRILVVTFRQQAPEYPKRVHIDWVRVDEVKLRAGRSDGVVFSPQSVPFKLYACTIEEKKWGTHHLSKERLAFKIHCDRLTGLLKLMTVFPPSPPLSLQSGSCYCTQSISCILESSDGHQDNHDGTLEVSSGVTSLFSLSLSLPHRHTPFSPLCTCLFSYIH